MCPLFLKGNYMFTSCKYTNEDFLRNAKILLANRCPFFGRVGFDLPWKIKELEMPTAATDGYNLYFDPRFLDELQEDVKLGRDTLLGVCIHEIIHVIKFHAQRRKHREPMLWNIAVDISTNHEIETYLVNRNICKLPTNSVKSDKYEGWLEEQIYDDLKNKLEKDGKVPFDNFDLILEPSDEKLSPEEIQRKVGKAIEAGAEYARQRGDMPGWLADYVSEYKEVQLNWQALLRRFLAPIFPKTVSWDRPNKRLINRNIYMPSVIKDGVGKLAICVDTSGSVSDKEINHFISEMNYILSEMTPEEVQIIWFEGQVWQIDHYKAGESFVVPEKMSRGGTVLKNAIEAIDINPKCVIVLSDLEVDFNGYDIPSCPTLFISTTDIVAPWGQTIRLSV